MKDTLSKIIIFTAGAAIGSVVTWKVVKTKYEQIAQEEIESVKEVFSKKKTDDIVEEEKDENAEEKPVRSLEKTNPELSEYVDKVNKLEYKEEDSAMARLEVIPPEDFGDVDHGYTEISLEYFEEDKVLINDRKKIIRNYDELVGKDFADHFGEYEEDSVFIRNHTLRHDYEILKNYGSFSEIS